MNALPEAPSPPSRLHNMSAPPRSVTDIRPLRTSPEGREHGGATLASRLATSSGTFFARVHLIGLLSSGQPHIPQGMNLVGVEFGDAPDLVDAVAMLRTGRRTGKRLLAERLALRKWPVARLHMEFLERVAALGTAGLPPVLLARPLRAYLSAPRTVSHLAALRLLAGTAGGLFVRARAPSAELFMSTRPQWRRGLNESFDFYLPAHHEH